MRATEQTVAVLGLSKADQLDLESVDAKKWVKFETSGNIGNRFGEPSIITAYLIISALSVLAAWIVKTRRRSLVEFELEVRASDGGTKRVWFKKEVTSETTEADVLEALSKLTHTVP